MPDSGALPPLAKATVFLAGIAGALIIGLKPALLSSYVSHAGINEIVAGYLVSTEVMAALIGTLIVFLRGHIWDRRRILMVGLLALIVANLLSAAANGAVQLGCVRFVAGLGEGLTTGLFAAVIAADPKPDRQFGLFTVIILLVAASAYRLVPFTIHLWGMAGFFGMLSIPPAFALVLSPAVPRRPSMKSAETNLSERSVDTFTTPDKTRPSRNTAVVLFCGAVAYYLSAGGVWPYLGQIGMSTGLSAEEVSRIFANSQVWGAVAAIVPMAVGSRFGRSLPIALSVAIGAACLLLLIDTRGEPEVFGLAAQAFMFGWLLFFPYLMGLTSSLDPLGRLSSLVYTVQNIGFFLGPILCAQAILIGGYRAVLWFGVFCFATTLVSLVPLAFKVDRRRSAVTPARDWPQTPG